MMQNKKIQEESFDLSTRLLLYMNEKYMDPISDALDEIEENLSYVLELNEKLLNPNK